MPRRPCAWTAGAMDVRPLGQGSDAPRHGVRGLTIARNFPRNYAAHHQHTRKQSVSVVAEIPLGKLNLFLALKFLSGF